MADVKAKFKDQPYQTQAVRSVVDCFAGQPRHSGVSYRIDPGKRPDASLFNDAGFKNERIHLSPAQILKNIQEVQRRQFLPLSQSLVKSAGCDLNLDVEMETGTGKTFCYIKTIFELNEKYGWSKFIIVVPSVAIREGVASSLEDTAGHFMEMYKRKIRSFVYDSKRLHELESFSSNPGINVMVINIQAFNATGKDNRRIYEELDAFQSRRPIDVLSANHPILILDEPQKMEGKKTLEALKKFSPLAILRYSATHKTTHNKVHRLDAVDAYNKQLVKKIAVRGITVEGSSGAGAYMFLHGIEISSAAPRARMEIEVKQAAGITRKAVWLKKGSDLRELSKGLAQYDGFVCSDINAVADTVEFINGETVLSGEVVGSLAEEQLRRIQIREAVLAHLEREQSLFEQGIKPLSLFFIDEVAKYRNYSRADTKGDYARIFEEEYEQAAQERIAELAVGTPYRKYLERFKAEQLHEGYFSIDKKNRLIDPSIKKTGEQKGLSDDVSAYDLILKGKSRLMSFGEPVRFIFSHSALREGWDNPNVFVMCMLKKSDNTISRRQEVGRGLRLAVNQHGDRMDDPATVHDINVLTVVAGESYSDFVTNLQREIADTLSDRPRKANVGYFTGKTFEAGGEQVKITDQMASSVHSYLYDNDYVDEYDSITSVYRMDREAGTLAALPKKLAPYAEQITVLIDIVALGLPEPSDGRKQKRLSLNKNFERREFQELWSRINHKAVYRVSFDSQELIDKCVVALDEELVVGALRYAVVRGEQVAAGAPEGEASFAFQEQSSKTEAATGFVSQVPYDLLGRLSELTQLTRRTLAAILRGIGADTFAKFQQNPEQFISEVSRICNEELLELISDMQKQIEHLKS